MHSDDDRKINKLYSENIKDKNKFNTVLRFINLNKNFSIDIPKSWTFNKLFKFIQLHFKENLVNQTVSFIYLGKPISDQTMKFETIFVNK